MNEGFLWLFAIIYAWVINGKLRYTIGFGFNSGQIESGRNWISFKTGTARVRFGSLRFGFELSRVTSGVGNFGSRYNSGFVRLQIGLLWVFGSKSVHPISGVGSGMDPDRSVRVSGLGSVLPGLLLGVFIMPNYTLLPSRIRR